MPSKIKKAWLKALRSGEYDQIKGKLTNGEGGFCCLGVLQHVVSNGSCEWDEYNKDYARLPSNEWLTKIGCVNGEFPVFTTIRALAEMNDGDSYYHTRGKRFSTIANWIEKNIQTTD